MTISYLRSACLLLAVQVRTMHTASLRGWSSDELIARTNVSKVDFQRTHKSLTADAPFSGQPLHGVELVIVAAHHKEELAWLDTVAKQCGNCHVYVYTSSFKRASRSFKHGTIREVPNVGREWGKYLRFIIDEWPALQKSSATVLFLHAHLSQNGADDFDRSNLTYLLPHWPTNHVDHMLFLHGERTAISADSAITGPVNYASAIQKLWPALFTDLGPAPQVQLKEEEVDREKELDLCAVSGAEFSVPAYRIVGHSLKFYQLLEKWLVARSPEILKVRSKETNSFYPVSFDYAAGSILELLAYRIFQGNVPLLDAKHLFVQNLLNA